MATRTRWESTDLATVLPVLTARLVRVTGLDATRVALSVWPADEVPTFAADQDVIVRVMGERPEQGVIEGAGRYDDRRERSLEVAVRTRVQLDQAGQALQLLTHASLGHLRMEDLVVEALQLFSPPSRRGGVLAAPLFAGRWTAPQRMKSNPDWVWSTLDVPLSYVRDLDVGLDAQFAP